MNINIRIIEIFPSINELMENKDDNIILVFNIKGEQCVFNMIDLIEEKITISLKINEIKTLIFYEIFRNENLIYKGEFFPFNDIKWLYSKKLEIKKTTFNNLFDFLRIKMKCSIINGDIKMKKNIKKNSKLIKKTNLIINNNKSNTNSILISKNI